MAKPKDENGNGNGSGNSQAGENGSWNCSEKQKNLIQKIVTEHNLEKAKVEALAQDRFGKGVKALNKLEASGLIEELLEQTGQNKGRRGPQQQSNAPHYTCDTHWLPPLHFQNRRT